MQRSFLTCVRHKLVHTLQLTVYGLVVNTAGQKMAAAHHVRHGPQIRLFGQYVFQRRTPARAVPVIEPKTQRLQTGMCNFARFLGHTSQKIFSLGHMSAVGFVRQWA